MFYSLWEPENRHEHSECERCDHVLFTVEPREQHSERCAYLKIDTTEMHCLGKYISEEKESELLLNIFIFDFERCYFFNGLITIYHISLYPAPAQISHSADLVGH